MRTYQQLDTKEAKQFYSKKMEWKTHNTKVKWINKMEKELQGCEKDPEIEIYLESFRATLNEVLNWKTPSHDGIHGF